MTIDQAYAIADTGMFIAMALVVGLLVLALREMYHKQH